MDWNMVTGRVGTGAGLAGPDDVQALVDGGITHVIDCRAEFDDGQLLAPSGVHYLWAPTQDDGQPKPTSWFQAPLLFALQALVLPHTRVYAHCAAGINRGPSMAYAVMRAVGWSAADALATIRSARPATAQGIRYAPDADKAVVALGYA